MALSFLWLRDRSITCDNESLIFAYQDGIVAEQLYSSSPYYVFEAA